MPTDRVVMKPNPGEAIADVGTGTKAELELPAGLTAPLSWEKNGVSWKDGPTASPPTPVEVDPTPGKDDTFKVVDDKKITSAAVVRWKPGMPFNVQLKPGRGNASVTWNASADEEYIDYYEVNLDPPVSVAQLPRKVKRAAGTRTTNRTLPLPGLPPGFYTASVSAVRETDYGPLSSGETKTTGKEQEVLPTGGPYNVGVRIALVILGAAAAGGAIYLLVTKPLVTHPGGKDTIGLNGWALGIAALVTFALVALLSVIVRIRDLLTGPDNRISTSRVNVALWTVAIAFGITTLAAFAFGAHQYHMVNPCGLKTPTTGTPPADSTVDGICVNGHAVPADQLGFDHTFKNGLAPNYLVLLGAPFVTLAGSAFIVNRQVGSGDRQKVESDGPNSFTDALSNDNGSADLVDSQYLIFTGVLFFYFLTSFIPNPSALPDLPWGLVGLTGVSAGTYLLNKSVATNGLSIQGLASSSVKQGDPARVLGQNFLPEGSAGLVNGGVSVSLDGISPAITKVSNTEVTFTTTDVPANTYNVRLTTAANVSAPAGTLKVT
jgi:hypothetical protein